MDAMNSSTEPKVTSLEPHLVGIRVGRCRSCGHLWYPESAVCPQCLSEEVHGDTVSGHGTIYSFSEVHRGASHRFTDATPYVLALVDTASGLRILTDIVGTSSERLYIGCPVRAVSGVNLEGEAVLLFSPQQGGT